MSNENNKEILDAFFSKFSPHFWFDIDGTLKYPDSINYPGGFNPAVAKILIGLQELGRTGASTDQSPFELDSFLSKMKEHVPAGQQIFTGPSVLEGGHVLVPVAGKVGTDFRILTSTEAWTEMQKLVQILSRSWTKNNPESDWGFLLGVVTPVALAEGKYQGVGSISIWEEGPDVHNPQYGGQYEIVMEWVKTQAKLLNIQRLDYVEAGNGTLRIIEKGRSKAKLIQSLHDQGAVDLATSVYIGDGENDIDPAALIKLHGGIVIAVANAHPGLKKLADIITEGIASDGVVEALSPHVEIQ